MGLTPSTGPAAKAATSLGQVTVAEFADAEWQVASGSGSVSTVGSPSTSGGSALRVTYDVTGGGLAIATSETAPVIQGAPRSLDVDVYGDGSWNVFYVELRDATGEVFRYWCGSLGFSGWQTLSVPVGVDSDRLQSTSGGDGDGVPDLPLALYQVVVYPGPTPVDRTSSIVVDRLVAHTDLSAAVRVAPATFAPSAGETADVVVTTADAGAFTLRLSDSAGFNWSWSGDAPGGATAARTTWNGRTSGGAFLSGSVSGRLSIARPGGTYTYDVPYAAGVTLRPATALPATAAGVNTTLSTIDTAARPRAEHLALLAEQASVGVIREAFDWHRVEPRRGYFDWAKFDQAVEVAAAHNLTVLGRLQYSAGWASSAPGSVTGSARYYWPPADNADFARYARAVVARYKDRVHTWEIWNEPNEANLWRPSPDATAYAGLLKAAYAAIKAEDPDAVVVLGGLSTGPDQSFLDRVRQAGAWGSFDVLGIHAFVNDDPSSSTSMFPVWLDLAASTVAAYGVKPIWITEWGWSTATGGVSETTQARYVARGFRVVAEHGIAAAVLYELENGGTSSGSLLGNYGTVTREGRFKPSYTSLACAAAALAAGRLPSCVVDTQRPTVAKRSPRSGATGTARDAHPAATFSEAVHGVSGSTVRLRDTTAGTWVKATVTYDAATRRAQLVPSHPLARRHWYRISVTSGIRDVAGNRLSAVAWSFRVTGDGVRPTVRRRTPGSGATGVSVGANVAVTFSEPMRSSTVTTATLRLVDSTTGAVVPASVTYDAGRRRATIDPTEPLVAGRTYRVVVASARDRGGNRVVSASWQFATSL